MNMKFFCCCCFQSKGNKAVGKVKILHKESEIISSFCMNNVSSVCLNRYLEVSSKLLRVLDIKLSIHHILNTPSQTCSIFFIRHRLIPIVS